MKEENFEHLCKKIGKKVNIKVEEKVYRYMKNDSLPCPPQGLCEFSRECKENCKYIWH